MAEKAPQQIIDEAIAKGAVLVVFYFDVSCNQKDAAQPILTELISRILREQGIISAVGEIDEPIEMDGMWSTSAEVTILAKNISSLAVTALKFGPIGVEVIRPDPLKLPAGEAQSLLLNVAQVSYEFSQFALEKLMDDKQRADFKKKIAARAEQGKKIMERMEKKESEVK